MVWSDTDNEYKEVEGKDVSYLARQTNNVSHDTGYVLTFNMDNPKVWDDYYTKTNDLADRLSKEEYVSLNSPSGFFLICPSAM